MFHCENDLALALGVPFDLTLRQRLIYDFARECVAVRGYGPTVREIAAHLNVRSLSAVRRHLRHLERRGLVRRVAFTARTVQLAPRGNSDPNAIAVVPLRPSVRRRGGRLVVDFGFVTAALGRDEAIRLARRLLRHAR
jgi:hypothetical protein